VLVAPELPELHPAHLATFVAMTAGLAAVFACIAAVAPVSDVMPLMVLIALGGLLLVAGLDAAGVGAAATPVEAIAYAAAGALFAVALLAPSLAIALPVFVAAVDVLTAIYGGPSDLLSTGPAGGDPLTLELPAWGTGLPAGRLGVADAVFAGVFLVYARRFGLRPRGTAVAMFAAAVAATAIDLWLDAAVPVLPLMAAGYIVVNVDRLPALMYPELRG
jgi:hypothetical protein